MHARAVLGGSKLGSICFVLAGYMNLLLTCTTGIHHQWMIITLRVVDSWEKVSLLVRCPHFRG